MSVLYLASTCSSFAHVLSATCPAGSNSPAREFTLNCPVGNHSMMCFWQIQAVFKSNCNFIVPKETTLNLFFKNTISVSDFPGCPLHSFQYLSFGKGIEWSWNSHLDDISLVFYFLAAPCFCMCRLLFWRSGSDCPIDMVLESLERRFGTCSCKLQTSVRWLGSSLSWVSLSQDSQPL